MKKLSIALLLTMMLFGCKKDYSDSGGSISNHIPATLTINQHQQAYEISPDFEGLSFETAILAKNPEYLSVDNSVLIQLLKNLGPGMLRIGGDTSDEIDWTGKKRTQNTSNDSLTTTDIDQLSAFAKVTGWNVLYGLNLGSNKIDAAANEAAYIARSLGNNLYAFQFGNEPDIYHMFGLRSPDYDVNNYQADWNSYYSAIKSLIPQASYAGPDVANNSDWVTSFAENDGDHLKMIDAHYYITGPASSPSISYHNLLEKNFFLAYYLQKINSESIKHHLPYRITECNSIYGGGKAGASDGFASALWALDLMWEIAQNNGKGINFHGGGGLIYSPIMMTKGIAVARPVYYGMLAFKYGNKGGKMIPAVVNNGTFPYNCTAYACANSDNTWSITIINKEETKGFDFNIHLSNNASHVDVARLTGPSMTSSNDIKFAGNTIAPDGTFSEAALEQYNISQQSLHLNVPAGSAAVITLR